MTHLGYLWGERLDSLSEADGDCSRARTNIENLVVRLDVGDDEGGIGVDRARGM